MNYTISQTALSIINLVEKKYLRKKMANKFIYILNSYSKRSDEHYFHIIRLLEEIARNDVQIALVIEKSDGIPVFKSPNVEVFTLNNSSYLKRCLSLYKVLKTLRLRSYNKVFTRISKSGIITSIIFNFFNLNFETYYWHSGTVFEFNKRKLKFIPWIKEILGFWFIKEFVTYFVTGPESMKEYYIKHGVKRNKILILYNDIDLERFKNDSDKSLIKSKLNIPIDDKVILFVHRLSPVRETLFYLPYIIEKFFLEKGFEEYKFCIIGGGSDKEKLEKEIRDSNLQQKVFILGSIPNVTIQEYYSIADVFINPTMVEGFPRVLIEAQALGLPIVTTDAGGIKDILPLEQQSYIVSKSDRDAFADALIKMVKNNNLEEIGHTNKEFVKKFSTQKVALMYINKLFNNEE
ncbi:glycosyltransferase family 4 protein [Flavobacterium columnare]|uniref:Glycosyltransferase family 1 protein n=1 Tax=Flavobacterium columnare TaxID=996 RepID=A0AA94JP77_9FLAO|nr:glycosyltransferase family 4 protein [Flavobacterium columnare]MCH4829054.1 glycosyltransferase family 4 protein [Flavobacterium columnare]MCH4833830.1 glycosyltransferase family 4 protein [Flavobacterium columnare]